MTTHDNAEYDKAASSDTLREQVAQAIHNYRHYGNYADRSGSYPAYREDEADVVIRVVLAAVADEIKALRRSTPVVGWPGLSMHKSSGGSWIHVDGVLAVVERLRQAGVSDGE